MFKKGDVATLTVNAEKRANTCKNHSATHLLQKALRTVLGTHVEQAGSYVDGERLRFDFNYPQPMTKEQITAVEDLVNEVIKAGDVILFIDEVHTLIGAGSAEGAVDAADGRSRRAGLLSDLILEDVKICVGVKASLFPWHINLNIKIFLLCPFLHFIGSDRADV